MFDWMNDAARGLGNFFSMGQGFTPDTPLSSPDAKKTDEAMSILGFGKNGESEFALPNKVMEFQSANNLKTDGKINPGGPTESAISNALQQRFIATNPVPEKTDTNLPDNVSVKKTGDNSYQASATFGPKPQTKAKPKIDPMTGLTDPLSNAPKLTQKTKKQMDIVWQQTEKKKTPAKLCRICSKTRFISKKTKTI